MSPHRMIQIAAAVVGCAGCVFLVYRGDENGAAPEPVAAPAAPEAKPKPAEPLRGSPAPTLPKPKPSTQLRLPDGSTVPVLNHAYGAPPLDWPVDRPWSPIVEKYVDPATGEEWYKHQDNSRTTTLMRYHSHINSHAPVTTVYHPAKVLPMAPDEVAKVKEEMAREQAAKQKAAKRDGARR